MDSIVISVIIPIYNVERYVERCIRSIMNQTYTDGVECIIVNDCTQDNSMQIVEKLILEYKGSICFKLIHHEYNRGLAAARNTGLTACTGDYIIHIDSDDYCELDMLEKMYKKAVEEDADVVIADYWESFLDKEIYRSQVVPLEKKEYAEAFLQGVMVPAVWNKLIRRSLLIENKLNSVEGIDMGEDTVLMHRLFFYVHKVVHLPMAFVHYVRYNSNSYCWNMSRKSLCDMLAGEKILVDFYSRFITTDNNIRAVVYRLRMQNQIPLLLHSKGQLQKKWNSLYSDIKMIDILRFYPLGAGTIILLLAKMNMLPVLNGLSFIQHRLLHPKRKYSVYSE